MITSLSRLDSAYPSKNVKDWGGAGAYEEYARPDVFAQLYFYQYRTGHYNEKNTALNMLGFIMFG